MLLKLSIYVSFGHKFSVIPLYYCAVAVTISLYGEEKNLFPMPGIQPRLLGNLPTLPPLLPWLCGCPL